MSSTPSNQNAITQAIILSAGKGTRMRPLTLDTPKPLIEVGGQPLIVWHINALKSAGITDITINTSWLSDKLMDALGDGSENGVSIRWSVEDDEPLETAGGIAKALADGKLDDAPFVVVNGDVWCDIDFSKVASRELDTGNLAHLYLVDNPEHHPNGDFALQNGMATEDTVLEGQDKLTFAGISVLSPKLVESVIAGQPAPLAPLLKKGMMKLKVSAEKFDGTWVDVGTPERLEKINEFINNGGATQHHGKASS